MAPGTSPAITAVIDSQGGSTNYEVAFEANNNELWTAGSYDRSNGPQGLFMAPGTSPGFSGVDNNLYCSGTGKPEFASGGDATIFYQGPNHLLRYADLNEAGIDQSGIVTGTDGTQISVFGNTAPSVTAFGRFLDDRC
jgi:hypothetical protein